MTTVENLPHHVQAAADVIHDQGLSSGASVTLALALHRAKLLAGDRGCHCNRPTADRVNSHQRGDEAFCQDSFREVQ